jgi:hypothetical protein
MVMTTPSSHLPEAWQHLIDGLLLLSRHHSNDISPLHCEHDTLTVMADPEAFAPPELALLDSWGFHPGPEEGTFTSYRFGSA